MAFRDELDNPLVFILLLTIAVFSTSKVIKWGSINAGHAGAASIFN